MSSILQVTDVENQPPKDVQLNMDQLKAVNAQLQSDLNEANERIENLEVLVEKQSKYSNQLVAHLIKLEEENQQLKLKLDSARGETSSEDSSSSPPLMKK